MFDRFHPPQRPLLRRVVVLAVALALATAAVAAPADARGRGRKSTFEVIVDNSAEACTIAPGSGLVHGGVVRMDYSTANRPFLRKPDGTVVRFNDVRKVDDLPNATYEVFTAEGNDPDGRVLETKTAVVDCPLPVNTAPDRYTVTVAAPLPDDPPVVVPVSDVLAAATDADGDQLSVIGNVVWAMFGMVAIDDGGTPNDFGDDVVTIDTNAGLQCGVDPTVGFVISDGRGGVTRYGTLRFDNPFGPTWLCGNPW